MLELFLFCINFEHSASPGTVASYTPCQHVCLSSHTSDFPFQFILRELENPPGHLLQKENMYFFYFFIFFQEKAGCIIA